MSAQDKYERSFTHKALQSVGQAVTPAVNLATKMRKTPEINFFNCLKNHNIKIKINNESQDKSIRDVVYDEGRMDYKVNNSYSGDVIKNVMFTNYSNSINENSCQCIMQLGKKVTIHLKSSNYKNQRIANADANAITIKPYGLGSSMSSGTIIQYADIYQIVVHFKEENNESNYNGGKNKKSRKNKKSLTSRKHKKSRKQRK